jgi:hypothetical protein
MEDEIRYVPAGKYTTAGDVVLDSQPGAPSTQREPLEIAELIAAVSSVTPSPRYSRLTNDTTYHRTLGHTFGTE